jgi:molecular chaperone GrpE
VTEQDRNSHSTDTTEKKSALQEHAPTQPTVVKVEEGQAPEAPKADPLAEALKEAADNRDRWLRAVAELENYKKRALADKSNILKYRNEDLLRDLAPVVDNFERALSHAQEAERCDPMMEGVTMILNMLRDLLGKYGLKEIEALDKPFDPHFHEAIARIQEAGKPNNTVINVMEKGYLYNDRLLRPSKVVVSMTGE